MGNAAVISGGEMKSKRGKDFNFGYAPSALEQVRVWALEDKSIHNKERDECCPDFSCCTPELLAPKAVRELYYRAELSGNHKVVERLLGEFLGKMVDNMPDKRKRKIYIAGSEASKREVEEES